MTLRNATAEDATFDMARMNPPLLARLFLWWATALPTPDANTDKVLAPRSNPAPGCGNYVKLMMGKPLASNCNNKRDTPRFGGRFNVLP